MRKLSCIQAILLMFALAACDGDATLVVPPGTGGGTVPDDSVFIGSGTGASFQAGIVAVSQASLQAGGSASLTVTFVDGNGLLVTDTITVTFSSPCAAGGLASITASTIETQTGAATATYAATGCSGDDAITATATVNGQALQATGTITVAAATVGSIEFVSAVPTNIGLEGTGGVGRQETSTVRFRVTDSTGGPVSDSAVDFSLNTNVGGISLTPTLASREPTKDNPLSGVAPFASFRCPRRHPNDPWDGKQSYSLGRRRRSRNSRLAHEASP